MSYSKFLVVVLPLICPSRVLAVYVAHHDGKAQIRAPAVSASAVSVSQMCFCNRGTPLADYQRQLWPRAHRDLSRLAPQPAGVHTLELINSDSWAVISRDALIDRPLIFVRRYSVIGDQLTVSKGQSEVPIRQLDIFDLLLPFSLFLRSCSCFKNSKFHYVHSGVLPHLSLRLCSSCFSS